MSAEEGYRMVQTLIDDLGLKMSRDQYKEFIDNIGGHIDSIQDCIREEDEASD